MKKVTVLLPFVQPMAFLFEPHEVVNLRELVRLGVGIFTKDEINISAAHVMAFSVEDIDEAKTEGDPSDSLLSVDRRSDPRTEEDGCNT